MKLYSFIAYIKQKISTQKYPNVLKQALIFQSSNQINHYPEEKRKKMTGLMEDGLGRNMMIQFIEQRLKLYNYLTYADSANIKVKETKMCVII